MIAIERKIDPVKMATAMFPFWSSSSKLIFFIT